MKLLDLSEIVIGKVIKGEIPAEHINPSRFSPEYQSVAKLLTKETDETKLLEEIGIHYWTTFTQAAERAGLKEQKWVDLLELAARREDVAKVLEDQAKRLRAGQEADAGKVLSVIQDDYNAAPHHELTNIIRTQGIWDPTGWSPLDDYMGGLPHAGLTIAAGPPSTGKTSLMLRIASHIVKEHPKKKVLIYTFEMTEGQIAYRMDDIKKLTKEQQGRILISDELLDSRETYADATRVAANEDLALIGIDFADLMSTEEETEQAVAAIYKLMARLAKKTGVPVLLLSQLNRSYVGGVPKITNIRWSGLAEAMAALILLLYNPNQIWADQGKDDRLPAYDGMGYIIIGKSRFGYKAGGGVGAIQLEWDGQAGWGEKGLNWVPLGQV